MVPLKVNLWVGWTEGLRDMMLAAQSGVAKAGKKAVAME